MPVLALILAAIILWAMWKGKIRTQQVAPILLGLAGAFLTLRGQFIIGIAAMAIAAPWYRGVSWRIFGPGRKQNHQLTVDDARILLGVSPHDDAAHIRARHRLLISQNHPDTGGNEDHAAELNRARDLLLRDLVTKSG